MVKIGLPNTLAWLLFILCQTNIAASGGPLEWERGANHGHHETSVKIVNFHKYPRFANKHAKFPKFYNLQKVFQIVTSLWL